MRLRLNLSAVLFMLIGCLVANASTINYTVTGSGTVSTFSLSSTPTPSYAVDNAFLVTTPITSNGVTTSGTVQFARSGFNYCLFALNASSCDNSSNVYFTGPATAPTLLTGTFTFADVYHNDALVTINAVSATPEPSSLALLGTGTLAVMGLVRRRLA